MSFFVVRGFLVARSVFDIPFVTTMGPVDSTNAEIRSVTITVVIIRLVHHIQGTLVFLENGEETRDVHDGPDYTWLCPLAGLDCSLQPVSKVTS